MVESAPTGRAILRGRQLSLFKGKRQKGVEPPSAKEFALHCLVAYMLRKFLVPGWIWTHLPMGELRDVVTATRLKRMGVGRGWPDLMFINLDGRVCFLELKRRGQKLTEDQAAIGTFLHAAGNAVGDRISWHWTDNFDDAITTLKTWGILRAGIT